MREVEWRQEGRIGRITLRRERALNALTLGMIRDITEALGAWREDPFVHAVLIESADERAFCAGGDIRAVREATVRQDWNAIETFFAEEYALNLAIATYPKPYIALIDGICMGGGIGISVHGTFRVATERARFAMPETGIGFFPDIGASHVLPRLPGALGFYLGLTGRILEGGDGVHAGFATHFVPHDRLAPLREALIADGPAVLAAFAVPPPPFSLAPVREVIDAAFPAADVKEILARLAASPHPFAAETLKLLRSRSPSALLWSHALLRRGERSTLPRALEQELALTRKVVRHPDFSEGVRAMVVDKDRSPRWQPATLEEVDPLEIEKMFE